MVLLVLGGCAGGVDDDDLANDGVVTLTTAADIGDELTASPAHAIDHAFVQLAVVYEGTSALEVSTSTDGAAWSEWTAGTLDPEASDAATDSWVANVDVASATYWRVRAATGAAPPRFLSVATRTVDDVVVEDATPTTDVAPGSEVAGTTSALTSFHIYSFDAGKVGRSWLWLLRACRARGWHGHLAGPRTGLRTYAQQLSLWNAYQNGTGAPAFPPWGPSRHLIRNVRSVGTWYQAVDTDDVSNLIRIARNLGVSLHTPYLPREPWHVEAVHAFGPPHGWNP